MNILKILDLIASDTKRSHKENILTKHKDNEVLKKVFWAAYNPEITYWIAAHPVIDSHFGDLALESVINAIINEVASRKLTGNAACQFYYSMLKSLQENDAEVLRRIIDRDLRCGVGIPTINKIWKDLIPTFEVMSAASDPKRLKFPDVVVQTKYDGVRCLVTHKLDGSIDMRTRSGNAILCLDTMHSDFRAAIYYGDTWDGELVCYDEAGAPLPRKVSNGIAYKAIRGTINGKEAELLRFAPWDIVDKTSSITYERRLQALYEAIHDARLNGMKKIIQIQSFSVESLEEVEKLFGEALIRGEEGVIAKNLKGLWEPKRSFNLCKFKAEKTADLVVVDWEEGTGKNKGLLGALVCESSDGKIRVNVGSGFSDEQRRHITRDNAMDSIVEVRYNARISKKDGGVDSLYLPRFIRFRTGEKNIADNSLNEIK